MWLFFIVLHWPVYTTGCENLNNVAGLVQRCTYLHRTQWGSFCIGVISRLTQQPRQQLTSSEPGGQTVTCFSRRSLPVAYTLTDLPNHQWPQQTDSLVCISRRLQTADLPNYQWPVSAGGVPVAYVYVSVGGCKLPVAYMITDLPNYQWHQQTDSEGSDLFQ